MVKDKKTEGLEELIIIKTREIEKTKKVEKFLNKEQIDYEIYNSKTSLKSKYFSPKKRNIEEVMKSFDRARIKV